MTAAWRDQLVDAWATAAATRRHLSAADRALLVAWRDMRPLSAVMAEQRGLGMGVEDIIERLRRLVGPPAGEGVEP